jgi:N-[(2S)-2-amino-2-carboxyethyl]-L-glutamate dehydrogenase
MPGSLGAPASTFGTKIINANPTNHDRGLPRASGLTLLFDEETARVLCVMDAGHISMLRTAAVSVIATELLGVLPATTLAVIGAGGLGPAHIELFAERFPSLSRILLFDLDPDRAQALQVRLAPALAHRDVEITVIADVETAVRSSSIVVPVTTTTEGYIPYEWLSPGCLLIHVSLDDAMPDVPLEADLVVVDDWELVRSDHRRLLGRMHRAGLIHGPDDQLADSDGRGRSVDAELGQLLAGVEQVSRGPDDVVLVNPFGLAIEDLAIADRVYRKARERGLGTMLER